MRFKLIIGLTILILLIAPVSAWQENNGCWTASNLSHNFVMWNSSGTMSWTAPLGLTNVSYLVVGGGGSGGVFAGGGGGAGAVKEGVLSVTGGNTYNLSVGNGATGRTTIGIGNKGQQSNFASIFAEGGGAGGGGIAGGNGGSGGGGSADASSPYTGLAGGTGTDGGKNGGSGITGATAGGGGGGKITDGGGANDGVGGNGGTGYVSGIILGESIYVGAGGGAAGTATGGTGGVGGSGGPVIGGNGSINIGTGVTNGVANTGSGGGGLYTQTGGIYSGSGGSGIIIVAYVNATAPIASFTQNVTSGLSPTVVQLTDTSTGSPTTWSYGAKNTTGNDSWVLVASTQNPILSLGFGNWSLNLTASNSYGSNISTQISWVNVSIPHSITANFTANVTSGLEPLPVQFTDTSISVLSTIDTWNWSFDDGYVSSLQNPEHTFLTNGSYSVNLTITNTSYSLISTKIMSIEVGDNPLIVDFIADITSAYRGTCIQFTDLSSGSPSGWNWSFGDGNLSTSQNPLHCYDVVGNFSVALNVSRVV